MSPISSSSKSKGTGDPTRLAGHNLPASRDIREPTQRPRFLLIDADSEAHEIFRRVAQAFGSLVDLALDEDEALSLAVGHCYHVIVVAAAPAEVSSMRELVSRLRTLQHVAAFLLARTQSNPSWSMAGFTDYGIAALVSKPWDEEELTNALELGLQLRAARQGRLNKQRVDHRLLSIGSTRDTARIQALLSQTDPGFEVEGARSIAAALELVQRQHYYALITEVVLPDACGLDAVQRLCKACPDVPLVILTALNDESLASEGLELGAQDFLVKQLTSADLLSRAIRHAALRQQASRQLYQLAWYDPLTQLANRRLLQQRMGTVLARARRKGQRFAVLYADLDDFKTINDRYGHDVGDSVLTEVSARLQSAVREYDTVARLGGDEFAILLDTLEREEEATAVAERILGVLARPIKTASHEIMLTASVGVSVYPEAGSDLRALLGAADRAMYQAKHRSLSLNHCAGSAPGTGSFGVAASAMTTTRAMGHRGERNAPTDPGG